MEERLNSPTAISSGKQHPGVMSQNVIPFSNGVLPVSMRILRKVSEVSVGAS